MTTLPNDVRARVLCFMDAESSTTSEVMDQRLAVSDLLRAYDEGVAEVATAQRVLAHREAQLTDLDAELAASEADNARCHGSLGASAREYGWLSERMKESEAENARLREAWKTRAPYLPDAPSAGDAPMRDMGVEPPARITLSRPTHALCWYLDGHHGDATADYVRADLHNVKVRAYHAAHDEISRLTTDFDEAVRLLRVVLNAEYAADLVSCADERNDAWWFLARLDAKGGDK